MIPYIFKPRNILLKQKMNLLFRNHRHGILWPFQNIFFSFPLPENTFELGDRSKWKIVLGSTEMCFFQTNPFIKKPQWRWNRWWEWNGMVCFGGVLYETLSKMGYASNPLCLAGTGSPEDATCLPKARHVAWWQCCPTSSPHTVMLPWEVLFPLHELKPESIYFNTNVTD